MLKKQNIVYENIMDFTPQELAKILEVDAVISGEFETQESNKNNVKMNIIENRFAELIF